MGYFIIEGKGIFYKILNKKESIITYTNDNNEYDGKRRVHIFDGFKKFKKIFKSLNDSGKIFTTDYTNE